MNEGNKKSAVQAAFLVVLMLVLGFAVFKMIGSMQPPKKKSRKATTSASNRPSSTNMPRVPGSAGDTGGPGAGVEIQETDLHLNLNQFKVYALNPPKNPFVQNAEWYKDKLEQVPGYPELKGSDYFEQEQAYLPNIPLIYQEPWDQIVVEKTILNEPYEIAGTSSDGKITTRVQLRPQPNEPEKLAWSRATGVPVKALLTHGWKERYGDLLTGELPAVREDGTDSGFMADTLGVPGAAGSDRSASDLLAGAGQGDALYCVGISQHGKQATALVRHNGKTRIVREGSVIPTHFQVLSVKEDGVVVIDLRDGTSTWLPLGAAPVEGKAAAKSKRKANDA